MAFPSNPTNGQQITVNGVVYTYNSTLTAWTVTSSGGSLVSASGVAVTGNITGGNVLSSGISSATANVVGGNITTAGQFVSTLANGTAPMVVTSTTKVANLNVEQVDGYHAEPGNVVSSIAVRDASANIVAANYNGVGVNVSGNVTGANINGFHVASAGTTAIAPIQFTAGSLLTNPVAGAMEFDANALYATENTTSGRGEIAINNQFRLTANGSAIGPTIANYFGASSAINLEANSYYDLDCMAYFLKSTAGTATWTWTSSSAVTMIRSYYVGTVATGFTTAVVTGTPVTGMAIQQTSTALAHAATGSLSSAVYHHFHFKVHVITNLATNLRLNLTQSAGTATPQAGSYYAIRKISATAGSFAA